MKPFYLAAALIILALSIIAFIKYKKITLPRSHNEVDSLAVMLHDLQSHLPPNATIGFKTNMPQERNSDLYFKSAFVLAPVVVKSEPGDTILVIQDRKLPILSMDGYINLRNGGNGKLIYSLIRVKN